jgi:multiple sugar transport system permease protein
VLFIIGPALYGVVMSLFDTSVVKSGLGSFAGYDNYAEALRSSDFWHALWHTVWFTILTTPPLVVLALVFAILAERVRRGRWFFRLAFFLPYVLPSAVVALIWAFLYTPARELAGKTVTTFGFTEPNWLGDQNWAMVSLAITTVWWTLGFNFVLYLAGLQEIFKQFFDGLPRDLDEAARTDGAGFFRTYRRIVLPLSRPVVSAVAIFTFVWSWNHLLWPLLAVTNPKLMTIPVGLATVQGTYGIRYADTMASAILGALPLVLVFLLFQRRIVEGIAGTGLKG